ncbi:MAG: hypothetical protein IJE08_02365 [Clostridia bacterium]|nr:hypothetical protein [Clostridia bacterium]
MQITGTTRKITYDGHDILFMNQRSPEWTHPYAYTGESENMHDAACGIFSIGHASQWMTGKAIDAPALADYARSCGGRGDDGTDRPVLLRQMEMSGLAAEMGFRYEHGGHMNNNDLLFDHIEAGNTAICNLRIGHIVAIVKSRIVNGEKQLLAIDSYSESSSDRVKDKVREIVPGTEIVTGIRNRDGLVVGFQVTHAMFWVPASLPRDFNLLYKL